MVAREEADDDLQRGECELAGGGGGGVLGVLLEAGASTTVGEFEGLQHGLRVGCRGAEEDCQDFFQCLTTFEPHVRLGNSGALRGEFG